MPHPMTLPTLAVLSLIGAGVGIHLGNASVAEIDPIYFDGSKGGSKFYADLTPNRARNWQAVQAAELSAMEAGETLHGCVGCRTYPEEYYPVHEASLGKSRTGYAEAAEEPAYEVQTAVMTPPEPPQFAQVERYTRYPMTQEEERELTSAQAEEAGEGAAGASE